MPAASRFDLSQRLTTMCGSLVLPLFAVAAVVGYLLAQITDHVHFVDDNRQLDEAPQENAALVEQSAAVAESLKQQSVQMVQAMAVFRLA